ncbi:MAG: sensor histidine kinase [Vulcanimicrobiaceae bacterium]
MIARLAARFLALFVVILAALDAVAFWLYARMYAALIGPALDTPEGAAGLHQALLRIAETIVAANIPLLIVVGIVSYLLAKTAVTPLVAARERERQFAADAAHELRSPLATIATVAQAARMNAASESAPVFDQITATALEASELIADLLTLAREPAPRLLQREPVDLAALVAECQKSSAEAARTKHVKLEVDTQSAIVDGDARRLKELLRNLVDNAMKHAQTHVRIVTRTAGTQARLTVGNDGDTIDPALREKIFERFFRATADGEGSGLGLAIVRWIARAHEGDVTVDSENGETRFTLSLPAVH